MHLLINSLLKNHSNKDLDSIGFNLLLPIIFILIINSLLRSHLNKSLTWLFSILKTQSIMINSLLKKPSNKRPWLDCFQSLPPIYFYSIINSLLKNHSNKNFDSISFNLYYPFIFILIINSLSKTFESNPLTRLVTIF